MPFVRLIGIIPLGIGLSVIFFVWTQPYSGFGAMPVFFRVFASFIALGFVMMGSAFLFAKTPDPRRMQSMFSNLRKSQLENSTDANSPAKSQIGGYQCSSCGATLEEGSDVSPHGDVKCDHCGKWFNIHQT